MTDPEFKFESGVPQPEMRRRFPTLEKKETIALIRVVRERKPNLSRGNQYREALNTICGVGIDHAHGLNDELMKLALGITKLSDEMEEDVRRWLPIARQTFDRALDSWREPTERRAA